MSGSSTVFNLTVSTFAELPDMFPSMEQLWFYLQTEFDNPPRFSTMLEKFWRNLEGWLQRNIRTKENHFWIIEKIISAHERTLFPNPMPRIIISYFQYIVDENIRNPFEGANNLRTLYLAFQF